MNLAAVRILRTDNELSQPSDLDHRPQQRKLSAVVFQKLLAKQPRLLRVHFGPTFDLWFLIDNPTPPGHAGLPPG
jgi:hypothetical protein